MIRSVCRWLVALGCLTACTRPPAEPLLRLEARGLRFSPPAQVHPGLTRVRLINRDPVWHEASLIQFTDSTGTLEGYVAAARAGNEYPAFAVDIGGVGFLAPGDSADVLIRLEPGRYAVVCWHRDHVLQGMGASFEVADAQPPEGRPPQAAELTLADFSVPAFTPAGRHQWLHVTNAGPSEHELAIIRLEPGKSFADFMAWRSAGEIDAPPGRTIAGTAALRPGAEIWLDVTWTAGRYLLLCLLEDGAGTYHASRGMQRVLEVDE